MLIAALAVLCVVLALWLGCRIGYRRGCIEGFVFGQSSAITELHIARKRWERPQ